MLFLFIYIYVQIIYYHKSNYHQYFYQILFLFDRISCSIFLSIDYLYEILHILLHISPINVYQWQLLLVKLREFQ
jgi:hypothetical protein